MQQPGWYPDPYAPTGLRWWDGIAWTAHAAPPPPVIYGVLTPDPRGDLASEQKWARRASLAIIAWGVITFVNDIVAGFFFGDLWRQFRNNVDTLNNDPNAQVHFHLTAPWAFDLLGLATLAPQVIVIVWLFTAAGVARNLHLPARRSQIWAILGFIVPVVSLWFPYQVAADLFPPGTTARRTAGHWWGWYLAQGALVIAVIGTSIASTSAAAVVAIVGGFVPAQMVIWGRRMIAAATQTHGELIGQHA